MNVYRLLFLALSFVGYIYIAARVMRLEFAIGFVFAGAAVLTHLAGMLGQVQVGVNLLVDGGVIAGAVLVAKKQFHIRKFASFGLLFFAAMAVFLLFILRNDKLTDYDNYTHWGVVVRRMLLTNRFPPFADCWIEYPSYPLGSASFIYYITGFIGTQAEWMQMFAQQMLILGMSVSLFAFCRKAESKIAAAALIVFMMSCNTNIRDLCVDTLLPVTAVSGFAFICYYRNDWKKQILVLPWLALLVYEKTSGLFFAAGLAFAALYCLFRKGEKGRTRRMYITTVALAPIAAYGLWRWYYTARFDNAEWARHSASVTNYRGILGSKGPEDIARIGRLMLENTFSWQNPALYLLVGGIALFIAVRVMKNKANLPVKTINRILLWSLIGYVIYQLGMYAMYLFSMPVEETVSLAGYGRYHRSMVIFLAGALFIAVVLAAEEWGKRRFSPARVTALAAALAVSFFALAPNLAMFSRRSLEGTVREKYDGIIAKYKIPERQQVAVLVKPGFNDGGYLRYMTRYLLNPTNPIQNVFPVDEITKDESFDPNQYDVVIAFDEDEEVKDYMTEYLWSDELVVFPEH